MLLSTARDGQLPWKGISYVLIGIIFINILLIGQNSSRSLITIQSPLSTNRKESAQSEGGLLFGQDAESIDGLTAAQCTEQFPKLYHEVDRAVSYWKGKQHTITQDDINATWVRPQEGMMRILIHDGELRILNSSHAIDDWHFRTRTIGILSLIQRALDSAIAGGEKLPTIETSIIFPDTVAMNPDTTHTVWGVGRRKDLAVHDRYWLIPNYDFWYDAPSAYRETRRRMMEYDASFASKIPKVVWRGSYWVDRPLRIGLLNATQEKPWADVLTTQGLNEEERKKITLKLEDMCKYAFTAHTEGVSYSGRLEFILNCQSLLIVHDLNWAVFYTHLLQSDGAEKNYAPVSRDWKNLEATVQHYLAHPQDAERIIANNIATFRNRYLTRAALSCYLRRLIQGYSTVAFQPDPFRPHKEGEIRYVRGVPFEKYVNKNRDGNFEDGGPD